MRRHAVCLVEREPLSVVNSGIQSILCSRGSSLCSCCCLSLTSSRWHLCSLAAGDLLRRPCSVPWAARFKSFKQSLDTASHAFAAISELCLAGRAVETLILGCVLTDQAGIILTVGKDAQQIPLRCREKKALGHTVICCCAASHT